MPQIPVISINANGMESNPGFTLTAPLIAKAMQAVVYGDVFMRVLYATRPYEKVPALPMLCMKNGKRSVSASFPVPPWV